MTKSRSVLIAFLVAFVIATYLSTAAACLEPANSYDQYLRQRWTVSNGFPGGRINAITQTSDGYLWIGTEKGLIRFDGFNFLTISHPTHTSDPVSQAIALVSTRDGALWVWDQDRDVRRYIHGRFDDVKSLMQVRDVVSTIARSQQGDLLVATQTPRLLQYSGIRNEALTPITPLGITAPQKVAQTSDGNFWMATYESGLFSWNHGLVKAVSEGIPGKINCLLPVANGALWIGTDEGMVLWDGHQISSRISRQALHGSRVLSLAEDRDKNLWIGTSNGLFRKNPDGLMLMSNTKNGADRTVTAIFEDREGSLWVGDAHGIERLRDGLFTTIPLGASTSPDTAGTGPIYTDALNRAWVAPSYGGLYCIVAGKAIPVGQSSLARDVIYSIAGFKDDLWVGRRDGGLTHFRQLQNGRPAVRAVHTYTHAQGLAQNTVSSVFVSAEGTIWAGTLSGGVSTLRHGVFATFTSADGLGSNTVTSIEEDRNGAMWFGTSDGLSRYANDRITTLRAREGLPSAEVTTLFTDSYGVLWIGTSQGLARFSLGQIHPILDPRPAFHEPIFGIAESKDGSLWFTSANHVFRVNRGSLMTDIIHDGDYREFGATDGLLANQGVKRDRSAMADAEGRVWISTLQGLSLVRLKPQVALPASAHVESVSIDSRRIDPYAYATIDPNPQRITIAYQAVSLAVPSSVRYRYKLLGFDHVWSDPTESRQVVYTNLGPGKYQFVIQISQDDDAWKGSDNVLSFRIQPSVSQTWWFRVLLFTAVGVCCFTLYHLRVKSLGRAMSLRFDERLDERTRMARELHDTFLQTVQGSKLVADDALATATDEARMRSALLKLSGWLGQAVTEGRAALHALRVSTTEQNELAAFLYRCAKQHCQQTSMSLALTVIGDVRELHPIVRDEVARIAEEGIRNAGLHSHASQLSIELRYARDLSFCIKDNGVGMHPEVIGGGKAGHFGIQGMKERSARIRAKFKITSALDAGTQISLCVPGEVVYRREKRSFLRTLRLLNLGRDTCADRDSNTKTGQHTETR